MRIALAVVLLCFIAACAHTLTDRDPSSVAAAPVWDAIDRYLGEEHEVDEENAIARVIREAMVALRRDYRPPHVPRDAHAKSHGCLTGSFTVNNANLPAPLRVGVFARNQSYPTWIRFSNNTSDPMSHDKDLDLRGIAIKLMNVPGKKMIPREADAPTQDFLMFASPIFFVKDIKDYAEFIKALGDDRAFQDLLTRPRSLVQLATAQLRARGKRNPLKLSYFSAVPFRLGRPNDPARRPVKYALKPCNPQAVRALVSGDSSRPNFMREALTHSLNRGEACFNFQVQVGSIEHTKIYPVEDPSVLWPETPRILPPRTHSPYVTVATLRIPRQDFNTKAREEFCENLSYTPWHALPEHKPLGRTNRMRLRVYEHISKYRHEANGVERREPRTLDPETAFDL